MRLSQNIASIFRESDETLVFRDILARISQKSFGVLLVILALPSALPLPAPGYSVPFGIVLAILAVQMVRERPFPWFPERVLNREIRTKKNPRLIRAMVRFLAFFETFVRPRLQGLQGQRWFRRGSGMVVLMCALSMCIPIPLTNTVPALGVFLIGLGLLEEDGLAGLAGIATAAAGILLTTTVLVLMVYFGWAAVDMVKDWIRGFAAGAA